MSTQKNYSRIIRRTVALAVLIVTVTLSIAIGNYFVTRTSRIDVKPSDTLPGSAENVEIFMLTKRDSVEVPIIMYHSVNTYRPNKYNVTPSMFDADLKFLLAAGYTPVFLSELTSYTAGKRELPRKPIVLSFDDGFYNNYSLVLPILKKHNAKIVLSIVGMYTDREVGVETRKNTYSYLNDSDLKTMRASGLVEFCNHTYDLHHIGKRKGVRPVHGETAEAYEKMLLDDTIKCEKVAGRCGIKFAGYTYPYGYFSKLTKQLLQKHGYEAILTCSEGINVLKPNDYEALSGLMRYNRPCDISTDNFFIKHVKLNLINPRNI